ncbi:MAG: ATP synthase F0 subunit B [Puniceicoccales bacterium]|jgi:F-type H+-transporting ATPase subunit b|nr:ATP synthase F0 subunit B [Puniceicoccales bacterium]
MVPSSFFPIAAGTLARVAGEFHVEWPLLLAQTFNFCVVAYVLHRFAFRPLLAMADERRRRIAKGLQDAEELQRRLQRTEAERDALLRDAAQRADAIVEDARRAAVDISTKERARSDRELADRNAKALEQLERERLAVLQKTVKAVKSDVAALAEKALLGGSMATFTEKAAETLLKL